MLKKTISILILSSFVIAQNPNPCEDPIFDKIEISDIHDLTEREFEYWKIMSKECERYSDEKREEYIQAKRQKNIGKSLDACYYIFLLALWFAA